MSNPVSKPKQDRLVPCERCEVPYPDWYLHRVTGSIVTGDVCGVCALEIGNAVLGIKRTRFGGEMANEMLWLARDWRRDHPVLVQKAREAAKRRGNGQP